MAYLAKVKTGLIKQDPHQLAALEPLQRLYDEIMANPAGPTTIVHQIMEESSSSSSSSWTDLFGSSKPAVNKIKRAVSAITNGRSPNGIYLWGGPGCGKTFMMDMFFESLDVERKQRVHFNDFMITVHKRLHSLKQDKSRNRDEAHLVHELADDFMREAYVLCFDEFQVTDIADAMILKSLLSEMLQRGCVVVATSNRPPSDLYKNGIQRQLFLPFIALLEERSSVVSMEKSDIDYRKVVSQDPYAGLYISPPNFTGRALFEQQFTKRTVLPPDTVALRGVDMLPVVPVTLDVYGHDLHVPQAIAGRRIAKFHFRDLCEEMLGAADFIDLAKAFKIVYIEGVPTLDLTSRNEMRRLITLVDALYECHTLVYCLADDEPLKLLTVSEEDRARSTHDEVFAFDRTVSRLLEMQSESYVLSWREGYYPYEGVHGLKAHYPGLITAIESATTGEDYMNTFPLRVLDCLNSQDLQKLYAEYNWGRTVADEHKDVSEGILGEALMVLMDDLRELRGGEGVNSSSSSHGVVPGIWYSYEEFSEMVSNHGKKDGGN